jgi:hypothetical protein
MPLLQNHLQRRDVPAIVPIRRFADNASSITSATKARKSSSPQMGRNQPTLSAVVVPTMRRTSYGALCDLNWIKAKTRPPVPQHSRATLAVADIFCGCGGLSIGAWEAARYHCLKWKLKLALDNSNDALAVYRKNLCVDHAIARRDDVARILPAASESHFLQSSDTGVGAREPSICF